MLGKPKCSDVFNEMDSPHPQQRDIYMYLLYCLVLFKNVNMQAVLSFCLVFLIPGHFICKGPHGLYSGNIAKLQFMPCNN